MATATDKIRKTRLDAEVGTIRKSWQNRIRVVLVYPNLYGVGMASLGFQTAYRLFNALDHVVCERAFLPDDQSSEAPLVSLESGRPLQHFDCVAFSLSFENDYANVLTILQKAGLPLLSAHRGASLPLILAGGVSAFLNPEPLAPFFDLFLIGEGEALIEPFFNSFDPARDRSQQLLAAARNLPGVYVPSFYTDRYHDDGTPMPITPMEEVPQRIQRVIAEDIDRFDTQSVVVTPHTSFEDAHLVEVSRGCPHGCRFCAAGYIYRPPRFRPLDRLQQALAQGAAHTGKVGLLGTAVSDLPDLKALCDVGSRHQVQLSFSSLRADALDPDLVTALKSGRLKTATIAPEAGSQRLRDVINKGLGHDTILDAAEMLVAHGIPNIKLYFMIGLPTETAEDIDQLITLIKQVKHRFLIASQAKGRMGDITVSLNSFVPKPFTPFQWVAMEEVSQLKKKIKQIKRRLNKVANVRVHADVPRWAHIQALFSRGDRRVAQLLLTAHQNSGNWPQTFKTAPINPAFFVYRHRSKEEFLPWEIIDQGLDRTFLWNEYQRALAGKTTKACPADPDTCQICGVCRQV